MRRYQLIKSLHGVAKPTSRKVIQKKTTWKVGIGDAWEAFAVELDSVADIPAAINKRKQFCVSHEVRLQPFLIVLNNQQQFALVGDDFSYLFDDFLVAIDIYFKIFFVFNLEYPFECQSFWEFIQKFFYDINNPAVSIAKYDSFIKALNI